MSEKDKKKPSPSVKVQKRRAVKYAMTASMAALVVTGLKKGKSAKSLHILSGIALMGLAAYHTAIYPKNQKS